MAEKNFKEFFGAYANARKTINEIDLEDEYAIRGELNQTCLKVFENYLYSYQWCSSDTERQLFDNLSRGISISKVSIKVERDGVSKTLAPASVRSASSRLSKKMYDIFGRGCFGILLGNPNVEADKIELMKFLALCISLTDDYVLQSHFSVGLLSAIENYIKPVGKVVVPDKLEKSKEMADVLTFFRRVDNDYVFSQLDSLDKKCVAQVYTVLSKKEYFMQRAEVLRYISKLVDSNENGVYAQRAIELESQLNVQKEDYEKRLRCLTENYKELESEANDFKTKLKELSKSAEDNKTDKLNVEANLQDVKNELSKVQTDLKASENKVSKLTTDLQDKTTELETITSELSDTKEALTQKTADFDKLRNEAERKLGDARNRIAELEAQVKSLSDLDL